MTKCNTKCYCSDFPINKNWWKPIHLVEKMNDELWHRPKEMADESIGLLNAHFHNGKINNKNDRDVHIWNRSLRPTMKMEFIRNCLNRSHRRGTLSDERMQKGVRIWPMIYCATGKNTSKDISPHIFSMGFHRDFAHTPDTHTHTHKRQM